MKANFREYKDAGKFLELIAETEKEVNYFEEIIGEKVEWASRSGDSFLSIICIPLDSFKNKEKP